MFILISEIQRKYISFLTLKQIRKFYAGEVNTNTKLPQGFGTCVRKNIKYTGEWKNGFPDGKGIAIYKKVFFWIMPYMPDEKYQFFRYEGDFKNGLFEGKGVLTRNSKLFYEGDFKNGVISGTGSLYNDNSIVIYKGEFTNGSFNGKGILYNHNGEYKLYDGNWKNGVKDGYGTLYNPIVSKHCPKYIGYWKNNLYNGKGKLILNNITRIGNFENDKQVGTGSYDDGNYKYTGTFKDNMFSGYGDLVFYDKINNKNNYSYSGNFLKHLFNGNGLIIYKNNNSYNGEFKDDLKHGKGVYNDYKRNYYIEAIWCNDKKNGDGSIMYNDGTGFKCVWQNDKLMSRKRLMIYEVDDLKITLKKKKDIPYELICPISLEIMKDPVICSDGHTYDRKSITTLFKNKTYISPTTREELDSNIIIPNYNIKKIITNL
jgi:hypothetical protein|tara:strand:- start:1516 stop:2802 length:1287 start_codon:yes stop_codon:yes gene_type:complete